MIDAATGAWLHGPYEPDPPTLGKGEELVKDVPRSFVDGLTVWDSDKRGFVDAPPPASALDRLLDVLALGRLPSTQEIAAIRAAQTKS